VHPSRGAAAGATRAVNRTLGGFVGRVLPRNQPRGGASRCSPVAWTQGRRAWARSCGLTTQMRRSCSKVPYRPGHYAESARRVPRSKTVRDPRTHTNRSGRARPCHQRRRENAGSHRLARACREIGHSLPPRQPSRLTRAGATNPHRDSREGGNAILRHCRLISAA